MYNHFFILLLFSFLSTLTIFHFTNVLAAKDDGFLSVNPEDYYILEDDVEEESKVSNQLNKENNTSDQNVLPSTPTPPPTTTTVKKHPFNIAVTADWGCEEDTKKTVKNIQNKNPELVLQEEI